MSQVGTYDSKIFSSLNVLKAVFWKDFRKIALRPERFIRRDPVGPGLGTINIPSIFTIVHNYCNYHFLLPQLLQLLQLLYSI